MIYLDCFHDTADKPIVAEASNASDINMSSIYTKLIQEAGRYCDHYASDILIDINRCDEHLKAKENATQYIAFRDYGTDHAQYIETRSLYDLSVYHAIYRLDVSFTNEKVVVTLQKVYYSYTEHDWKEKMEEMK